MRVIRSCRRRPELQDDPAAASPANSRQGHESTHAMVQSTTPRRFRFANFELDTRSGELPRGDVKVRLQEQPFQVLLMLLEHAGDVVTREEMRRQVWRHETFVDFDHGLNSIVNRLRDALGDSAENPRFIETLPRRGYRFLAPVEEVSPQRASSGQAQALPVSSASSGTCGSSRSSKPNERTRALRQRCAALAYDVRRSMPSPLEGSTPVRRTATHPGCWTRDPTEDRATADLHQPVAPIVARASR
jgi:DNA-binding winged helix-turn-helix (wHTH) protein